MAGFLDLESADEVLLESGDILQLEETFTVATRTGSNGTDGTSHTVTLPNSSNVSGRLVVVAFSADNDAGTTISWPSGWTEIGETANTGCVLAAAYRFIDGTEGFDGTDDTITVTTSASEQSNHHAYLISSGQHTTQAPEAATAAPATPNPPSLDPAGWAAEENLWIAVSTSRFSGTYTTAPTNYINLLSTDVGSDQAPLGSAWRVLNAASEDPGVFTENGGNNLFATITIAIRPASVGTNAPAGNSASTGTANQPEAGVSPNAGNAASTGSAFQPTVVTGTLAPAGFAAATGTADQLSVTIAPEPGSPSAAGTADQPEATIGAKPNTPEATGVANQATVETGANTNAPAGLAAATGTAGQPEITISPNAGVGLAAGVANQPASRVAPQPGAPVAAGTAPQATADIEALAFAGLATAVATAFGATADLDIKAAFAAAVGEAFPVFGLSGNPLGAGDPLLVEDDDNGLIYIDNQDVLEVSS